MTRTVPVNLLAHYQLRVTTLCHVLKITRAIDGVSVGYTTASSALTISGFTYEPGLDLSTMQTTSGLTVGNLEVSIFPDEIFSAADLLAGIWNEAVFVLGIANRKVPTDGIDVIKTGKTGQAELNEQGFFKLEFRGLMQAFQQPVGEVTQKTCKADLGDVRCRVDLAPWTELYAVGTVTSQHVFLYEVADPLKATDYFTEGSVLFTTGANAGLRFKVKYYTARAFTLQVAAPFPILVGDEFTAIAGCQKRLIEDCKTKFNNVLNNQSEAHSPGRDKLMADPTLAG